VQTYSVEATIESKRNFIDEAWLDSLHNGPIAGLMTCFAALDARQVQTVQQGLPGCLISDRLACRDLAQAQRFSTRLREFDNVLDWGDSDEADCFKAMLDFLDEDFNKIKDDLRTEASRGDVAELLDSQPESGELSESPRP
jgi:hypothetical protein